MGLHGCHPVHPEPQFKIENISNDSCLSENPSIACSPSGTVSIAWEDCKAGPSDIWLIEKPLGGQWGPAQNLTQNTNIYNCSRYATICYDSAGNLHAVWQQALDEGWVIFYRKRDVAGTWSVPETIRAGLPTDPKLAVDLAGNVHVLLDNIAVSGFDICHTMRTTAGTWTPIVHIGDQARTEGGSEVLAVAADGTCYVAWDEYDFPGRAGRAYGSIRSPDGFWTATAPISDPAPDSAWFSAEYPALVAVGDSVYLAYLLSEGIHFRKYTEAAGWQDVGVVSARNIATLLSLTADSLGRLYAEWEQVPYSIVLERYDRNWSQVTVTDTGAGDAFRTGLVVDSNGRVNLVWDHTTVAASEAHDVFYAVGAGQF
jgi:hypothetical protein